MATPGELVRAISAALGISEATVAQFDRQLAEDGLRSKSGRGRSAARVTARDAANLLVAIAASPLSGLPIKDAARTCEAYGSLPVLDISWGANFKRMGLPSLAGLPPAHSLSDALSVVIEAASVGEMFKIAGDPGEEPMEADYCLAVRFEGPRPWAEISADGTLGERRRTTQVARLVYTHRPNAHERRWKRRNEGDLYQSRWVSFATIRKLGSLLATGAA